MNDAIRLEAFLALIYVDEESRARFLRDPIGEASRFGLLEKTCAALTAIDREGLELAAASLARKRGELAHRRSRCDSDAASQELDRSG